MTCQRLHACVRVCVCWSFALRNDVTQTKFYYNMHTHEKQDHAPTAPAVPVTAAASATDSAGVASGVRLGRTPCGTQRLSPSPSHSFTLSPSPSRPLSLFHPFSLPLLLTVFLSFTPTSSFTLPPPISLPAMFIFDFLHFLLLLLLLTLSHSSSPPRCGSVGCVRIRALLD